MILNYLIGIISPSSLPFSLPFFSNYVFSFFQIKFLRGKTIENHRNVQNFVFRVIGKNVVRTINPMCSSQENTWQMVDNK